MTKHFKCSLILLLIAAVSLIGGYQWLKQRLNGGLLGTAFKVPPPVVLPKADKELVSYNDKTHRLTIVTADKTIIEYAKNPTVEIRKNGDVVVARHLLGFETESFLGLGYASRPTVFVGADIFHFSRLDIHGEIGFDTSSIRPYIGIGYNVWSNTSLNVSLNPFNLVAVKPDVAVFVALKF